MIPHVGSEVKQGQHVSLEDAVMRKRGCNAESSSFFVFLCVISNGCCAC